MRAIVLTSTLYADHSYMVRLLTRDEGLVTVSVRSAGRTSRFRPGYRTPLTLLDVELGGRPSREVRYVADVSPIRLNAGIAAEPRKMMVAQFVAETTARAVRYPARDAAMFDFVEHEVLELDALTTCPEDWAVRYLFRLMLEVGIMPDLGGWRDGSELDPAEGHMVADPARGSLDPAASRALVRFLGDERASLTDAERRHLLCFAMEFFRLHLDGFGSVRSLALMGFDLD